MINDEEALKQDCEYRICTEQETINKIATELGDSADSVAKDIINPFNGEVMDSNDIIRGVKCYVQKETQNIVANDWKSVTIGELCTQVAKEIDKIHDKRTNNKSEMDKLRNQLLSVNDETGGPGYETMSKPDYKAAIARLRELHKIEREYQKKEEESYQKKTIFDDAKKHQDLCLSKMIVDKNKKQARILDRQIKAHKKECDNINKKSPAPAPAIANFQL